MYLYYTKSIYLSLVFPVCACVQNLCQLPTQLAPGIPFSHFPMFIWVGFLIRVKVQHACFHPCLYLPCLLSPFAPSSPTRDHIIIIISLSSTSSYSLFYYSRTLCFNFQFDYFSIYHTYREKKIPNHALFFLRLMP